MGVCYGGTDFCDLDLDWDEAPQIADTLMPDTLRFGRPSRRAAHRVYRCPDLATGKKYTLPRELSDVEHPLVAGRDHERMVVEVNSAGQAVWPPSPHESSGETISFDGDREPSDIELLEIEEIEPAELVRLAGLISFATVCAAAYPSTGDRHDYCNAICGALVRAGTFTDEEIIAAVGAIAREGGDDEADDRPNEITPAETREKLSRGDPVTGLKRLVELMGVHDRMPRKRGRRGAKDSDASGTLGEPIDAQSTLVRTFRRWLADEHTAERYETLDALNRKLAIMSDGAAFGKLMVIGDNGHPYFAKPEEVVRWYANQPIYRYNPKTKEYEAENPYKFWVNSPERREVPAVVFEPPGSPNPVPEGALNLWQGFGVVPEPGTAHEPFLRHVWENICQRDHMTYEWVLAWLADLVQQPGNKPGVVIVLRGKHGTGKSILLEHLRKILGVQHCYKSNSKNAYTGRFNMHLRDKVLLGLEEAFHAGDRAAASQLKDLITSSTIETEQKFHDAITLSNHLHLVITANHDWTVPVEAGDRRYMVLDVSDEREKDHAYFGPIWNALTYGTAASNLLDYLQNYNYSRADLFPLPRTEGRSHQIELTLEAPDQWLLAVVRGDQPLSLSSPGADAFTFQDARDPRDPLDQEHDKRTVFTSFRSWADSRKVRGADGLTDAQFWKRLRAILGDTVLRERRRGKGGRDGQCVSFTGGRAAVVEAMAAILECSPAELDPEHVEAANDDHELERQLREIL